MEEAVKLDRNIDLPMWLSTLTLEDQTATSNANNTEEDKKLVLPFYRQKDLECEWLEKQLSTTGGCSKAQSKQQLQRAGKSLIANPKGKLTGQKRVLDGYNKHFLYSSEQRRVIGQLMHDMLFRIEQKALEEEEIISRISKMRSEKVLGSKKQRTEEQTGLEAV